MALFVLLGLLLIGTFPFVSYWLGVKNDNEFGLNQILDKNNKDKNHNFY